MKKLDIFNHILPRPFYELMMKVAPNLGEMGKRVRAVPMLYDLDERFRVMDRFPDYHQVLSLASPPLEAYGGPEIAVDLARAAHDGMAGAGGPHPRRLPPLPA